MRGWWRVTSRPAKEDEIALFIDGDNIPPNVVPKLIDEITLRRRPKIAKAFLARPSEGWSVIGAENGIDVQLVQSPVAGKNLVDMVLIVEAMEAANDRSIKTICIVSSDTDFIYLAHKLRARGKTVWGFGFPHTPTMLQAACSQFTDISQFLPRRKTSKADHFRRLKTVKRRIVRHIEQLGDENGWVEIGKLDDFLRDRNPGFETRSLGYEDLHQLLASMQSVEIDRQNGRRRVRRLMPPELRPPSGKAAGA